MASLGPETMCGHTQRDKDKVVWFIIKLDSAGVACHNTANYEQHSRQGCDERDAIAGALGA